MKKKCDICGKVYEYCPICPRDMYKPTWMNRFDDERCKTLWDTLSANGIGDITATEALDRLNEIDYKTIPVKSYALKSHINTIEEQAVQEAAEAAKIAEDMAQDEANDTTTDNDATDDTASDNGSDDDGTNDTGSADPEDDAFLKPKKRRGFKH